MKIDFVSDVSCPWCVIGLYGLEEALRRMQGEVDAQLHFQPFELNPHMAPEGQDLAEHIKQKYGAGPEESQGARETIRARGAELGFTFNYAPGKRIYNTFDAHRLLHWAELEGRQGELKHALFKAYFTDAENPSDHALLVRAAEAAGLDPARAAQVLAGEEYKEDVRARQRYYRKLGIQAVPSLIINDRHLITGGQPPEVFEKVLRRLIAEEGVN